MKLKRKISFNLGKEVSKDKVEQYKHYFAVIGDDLVLTLCEGTSLFSLHDLTYYNIKNPKLENIYEALMEIQNEDIS